jgi:LmbE family N-acetylglucosaminyl deacetylase
MLTNIIMRQRLYKLNYLFILLLFGSTSLFAQNQPATTTNIYKALKKINVLGSVLYIAAHPDDENTSVLSYMAQGKLVRAAYLSLTRGDGGQNLLGNEKGALLGIIRTQELLSARRVDGAEQFFSRAIDFGYSKTPDETLQNWDREKILGDIVKVIRLFKPDIIMTRFSESQGGHGHHLVSAILAKEAFFAAADPNRYPEQLDELETWQAKRIFWNTWSPGSDAISLDVGKFDPHLGKSYQEFAAASRTMHKSQGFGVSPERGEDLVWFNLTAGDVANSDLFSGVDISWQRVENSNNIQEDINSITNAFNPDHPADIVPALVDLYKILDQHSDNQWINIKKDDVKELIRLCSGLWMESTVDESGVSPGMSIDVQSLVLNRSNVPILLERIETTYHESEKSISKDLINNKPFAFKQSISIPANTAFSQPFWLEKPNNGKMYSYSDEKLIYMAQSPSALVTKFSLKIYGSTLFYTIPVRHRWNDATKGEQFRPFIIRPSLSVAIDKPTYVFAGSKLHNIDIRVKTTGKNISGELKLELPEGWEVQPNSVSFNLRESGDQILKRFQVKPGSQVKSGDAKLIATTKDGTTYRNEIIEIAYDHIPLQTVLQPAKTHLVNLDITVPPGRIGYIIGSGDEIPEALTQLGYEVVLLSDQDLEQKDLSVFDAIICGVRAFNTREELVRLQKRLITYVEQGGTWIVQHNTRFGFEVGQIGPYPFSTTGRDRISDENASLKILVPDHQLFNYPNKITQADFDNWVQERGLYFADSWEGKLIPLLSGNDKGEPSKLGGLLYAPYGKGVFIFTAYSWFRQLPAGVPGAYRLFVNMISAKGNP